MLKKGSQWQMLHEVKPVVAHVPELEVSEIYNQVKDKVYEISHS